MPFSLPITSTLSLCSTSSCPTHNNNNTTTTTTTTDSCLSFLPSFLLAALRLKPPPTSPLPAVHAPGRPFVCIARLLCIWYDGWMTSGTARSRWPRRTTSSGSGFCQNSSHHLPPHSFSSTPCLSLRLARRSSLTSSRYPPLARQPATMQQFTVCCLLQSDLRHS
ncbi:hypothetical protein IWX50DRAFT_642768 [Phyllosticta citricarpa]